eukprot:gene8458-biopygen92
MARAWRGRVLWPQACSDVVGDGE